MPVFLFVALELLPLVLSLPVFALVLPLEEVLWVSPVQLW
jgi:hypothetical protein